MLKAFTYISFIFLILFILIGCAAQLSQVVKNIDVNLENVEPKIDSLDQGTALVDSVLGVITGKSNKKNELEVDVLLNVKNSNNFALDISQMTYDFFVNDEEVANGLAGGQAQQLRIDPGQEKTITLPVNLGMDKVFDQTLQALLKGSFNARVKGVVTVNTWFGKIPVPYSVERQIKTR